MLTVLTRVKLRKRARTRLVGRRGITVTRGRMDVNDGPSGCAASRQFTTELIALLIHDCLFSDGLRPFDCSRL